MSLDDAQWARISAHIIDDDRSRCTSGRDNRMFVEGVLWIVRTGSPWRDLPEVFGEWKSVFRRFIAEGAVAVIPNNPFRTRKYTRSTSNSTPSRHVVMLRHPGAAIAPSLGKGREITGIVERAARIGVLNNSDEIEDRRCRHECSGKTIG
jgi:transposase